MPALKSARSAERKHSQNQLARGLVRGAQARALVAIQSGDVTAAERAVLEALSTLDRAERKGIVHANNVSRHKSRLMARLNKMKAGLAKPG